MTTAVNKPSTAASSQLSDGVRDAMHTTPPTSLRSALEEMCMEIPEVLDWFKKEMMAPTSRVLAVGNGIGAYDNANKENERLGLKRKFEEGSDPLQPRYSRCENCKEKFDVLRNGPAACSYHDGDLSIYVVSYGCSIITCTRYSKEQSKEQKAKSKKQKAK